MTQLARTLFASFATLLLVLSTAAHAGDLKVGIVDFTRALEATESDGALSKLKKEVADKKAQLKSLETEILAMEEDLKMNGAMLSEEKKKEALMGYQRKAYEFQQMMVKFEQEINQRRAEVLGKIHQKMSLISNEIAKEKKLDLMFERNEGAVLYFNGSFDYTDELIKRYQAQK